MEYDVEKVKKRSMKLFLLFLGICIFLGILGYCWYKYQNTDETDPKILACYNFEETNDYIGVNIISEFTMDNDHIKKCQEIIKTSDNFALFREKYKSNDNYYSLCNGKGSLSTQDQFLKKKITIDDIINPLIVSDLYYEKVKTPDGKDYYDFYDESKYKRVTKNYEFQPNTISICVNALKTNSGDLFENNDQITEFCNGNNVSGVGSIYSVFNGLEKSFTLYSRMFSVLLDKGVLEETDNKLKYLSVKDYDKDCGTEYEMPEKLNGKRIISFSTTGGLTNIIFSKYLRYIYNMGVNDIETLTIPKNIRLIGDGAFIDSKIKNVIIEGNVILGESVFNTNYLESIEFTNGCNDDIVNLAQFENTNVKFYYGGIECPRTKK